ncbi:hypothetical protein BASA50_007009 [Batrachochytrium salamandrivorans]|uniref:PPM-type phosphatase domain-containing protein n=1 Tax=Batrachochytrium salamandrivorans TaxID=1357716 RepID=A0ABQ8F879_9FUNG|nr:hypothetical protein BASA50_007009 [Batrachochytrium salamandrivorans]
MHQSSASNAQNDKTEASSSSTAIDTMDSAADDAENSSVAVVSTVNMTAAMTVASVITAVTTDTAFGLEAAPDVTLLRTRKSRMVSNVGFLDHDMVDQDNTTPSPSQATADLSINSSDSPTAVPSSTTLIPNHDGSVPPSSSTDQQPGLLRVDSKRPFDGRVKDDTAATVPLPAACDSDRMELSVTSTNPASSDDLLEESMAQTTDPSLLQSIPITDVASTSLAETAAATATAAAVAVGVDDNDTDMVESTIQQSDAIVFPSASTVLQQEEPPLPLLHHNLTWSVAAQEGYRISDPYTRAQTKLHEYIEDVHFPAMADQPFPFAHDDHTCDYPRLARSFMAASGAKVFIIADGHGGAQAPRFFASRLAHDLLQLLDGRHWDLAILEHRSALSSDISSIFKLLDVEYASMKVAEYRSWLDLGMQPQTKPSDDGCTMVVNIVHLEWIVNCNVGDSRTVIGAKLPWLARIDHHGSQSHSSNQQPGGPATTGAARGGSTTAPHNNDSNNGNTSNSSNSDDNNTNSSQWIQLFASDDHNMMHPEKVARIHDNGGKFLDPQGTSFMSVDIQPVSIRGMKPYTELNGSRIFRPMSSSIRAVGCSHRRTLNLTATMGDLLFKIEPAILSSLPDIRFIKLEPGMDYVLVAATDGVWDHMCIQYPPAAQNDKVLDFITRIVQSVSGEPLAPKTPSPLPSTIATAAMATDDVALDSTPAASVLLSGTAHSPAACVVPDRIRTPSPIYDVDPTVDPTALAIPSSFDTLNATTEEATTTTTTALMASAPSPLLPTPSTSQVLSMASTTTLTPPSPLSSSSSSHMFTATTTEDPESSKLFTNPTSITATSKDSSPESPSLVATPLLHPPPAPVANPLFDAITYCAQTLVRRETETPVLRYKDHGLFVPLLGRYDDATAMILYFTQSDRSGGGNDAMAMMVDSGHEGDTLA